MTSNDSRGPLAPHDNANPGGQDGPFDPIRDPLMAIAENVGDDPSVSELIAFRRSVPDLQAAAIDAKRCDDEARRLQTRSHHPDPRNRAWVALAIAGLSCSAIVAIWTCDSTPDAEAKMALAEAGAFHGEDADRFRPVSPTSISVSRATGGTARCRLFAFNPWRWREEDGHCREKITPHERVSS